MDTSAPANKEHQAHEPKLARYTICVPTRLNKDFEVFLKKMNEKRQKVIREQIEKWVQELKAIEAAKQSNKDDQQVA